MHCFSENGLLLDCLGISRECLAKIPHNPSRRKLMRELLGRRLMDKGFSALRP